MATHTTYAHELAISAVAYDALLVGEVVGRIATRLRCPPVWTGTAPFADGIAIASPLNVRDSRAAMILVQRLWGHDAETAADAVILRDRARQKPDSVVVVSLDDEPLARWMAPLQHRALATEGVGGIVEFVLNAIVDLGGTVRPESQGAGVASPPEARWPEPPTPYLAQPRALGALRRELDCLCAELEPRFEMPKGRSGDHILELLKQPHRVVARLDDVGVTFSWVPGRSGAVADGRLMVIEWSGVAAHRGVAALRTARPVRECVYSAEASGADDWCWRAAAPNGRASSTTNLVREWIAGITIAHAVASGIAE